MNISIDNRYCNRFIHLGRPIFSGNRSGASVYNPDLIWQRACAYRCYTREPPVIQSATRVVSSLLDRSMLSLFHEPIMSPIIVFTSSPTCLASKNSIAIDLITIKDRFLQHRRPATIWYFFLDSGDCAMSWAFRVLQKICRIEYSLQFVCPFGNNISLSMGYLGPAPVFH